MKKLLFTLAILSGGVLSAAFAQTTSRTLPDEARNVKNDPVLVRQFLEKSRNFQKRQMSSESGFQQVRPLTRKKSDVIIDAAPSLSNLKLNGAVVYDENKDVNTFGLYSFSAQASGNPERSDSYSSLVCERRSDLFRWKIIRL